MAKTEHGLSGCMIVEQFDPQYFKGWSEEDLECVRNKDIAGILKVFERKATENNISIQESFIINHNRDEQESWDDYEKEYILEKKVDHFHIYLKFFKVPTGSLPTVSSLSVAFGIESDFIEKPKKGKYSLDNMVAYLIHAKDIDKFQYVPQDVVDGNGILQRNYFDIWCERKKAWEKGRAKKIKANAIEDIDDLYQKIVNGEVTRDQILLTDNLYKVYSLYIDKCDKGFKACIDRKIAKAIRALDRGEFKISVIYVTGLPGVGKSHFIQSLAKSIVLQAKGNGEDWSICEVAATNCFDDYAGEEIVIMDDVRGNSLLATDWLKLMGVNDKSPTSARYKNKRVPARTIIIGSHKDPLEFFYYTKDRGGGAVDEPIDQFFRRIMQLVQIYRVPNNGERRLKIASSEQKDNVRMIDDKTLHLHYDFTGDPCDLDYDDAILYLSYNVMSNCGYEDLRIKDYFINKQIQQEVIEEIMIEQEREERLQDRIDAQRYREMTENITDNFMEDDD